MAEREMRVDSVESDEDAEGSWCIPGHGNSTKNYQVMPSSSSNLQVSRNKGNTTEDMFSQVPVFPEELWEVILNLVQDSESVQNMLLAFPNFRTPFERKIPLWLFDQVFPHLFPYLTEQEVRRCTQVCMTWKLAISKFAEDHPSRRPYSGKLHRASIAIGSSSSAPQLAKFSHIFDTKFETLHSINTFLQMSPSLHMNPFIGRYVFLDPLDFGDTRADFDNCEAKAELLLKKHGKHIWYFKICGYTGLESGAQFYERLKLRLSLMPNLRSLNVRWVEYAWTLEKYELPLMPLPPLPSLESLTLDWRICTGELFVAIVRSYVNEGLHFLSIQTACLSYRVMREFRKNPDVSLSGLTELRVDGGNFVVKNGNFMKLVPFLSHDHLQKLTISGIYPDRTHTIFRVFEGFKKLRVLEASWSMQWPWPACMCLSKHGRQATCKPTALDKVNSIKLPALHVLRVDHEWPLSYRFLAWIDSPVNLEITADDQTRRSIGQPVCYFDEITQELHKWICQERTTMNKSLIWNLVPGLQSLKLIYKRSNIVDMIVYTYRRADFLH